MTHAPRKFRVWDGDTMHEPSMRFRIYADGTVTQEHHGFGIACEDDSQYEVMWYTGLTDTAGHDIYQGDIVRYWSGETGEVQWIDFHIGVRISGLNAGASATVMQDCTVIGNRYENPDLLNEQVTQ